MSDNFLGLNMLDYLLLAATIAFGLMGYRQGFVIGVLSFVGFIGGAILGLQLAPLVANWFDAESTRLFVALVVAFGVALGGQSLALAFGVKLRAKLRNPQLQTLDSVGGSLVSAITMLLVAWMIAAPLASVPEPWVAKEVRNSSVLSVVDSAMPGSVRSTYRSFSDAVRQNNFPEIFGGLTPTKVPAVASPDPALAHSEVARSARRSVVKVIGDAPSCERELTGSGFVYASHHIMTNAHVVAGTNRLKVQLLGHSYSARVVVYDPRRDLAVLYAPNLDAPVLPTAGPVDRGADAIVVGFPQTDPYTVVPARIRERGDIRGPDIYQEANVTREVYSIRSTVRPGNSGGPLLSPNGSVYGIVFAAAVDDSSTGYALTAAEAAPVAAEGKHATSSVSTQGCD